MLDYVMIFAALLCSEKFIIQFESKGTKVTSKNPEASQL